MMSKKRIILTVAAFVLIAIAAYVGLRLRNRWTDIKGVTTVYERNTVYMNVRPGKDFAGGSGYITVEEGKSIHVEYAVETGKFDIALNKGSNALSVIRNSDLDNLSSSGNVFGKSGISGKGSIDFEAEPGEYTIYFNPHDTIGSAIVTVKSSR
ncbi:MAG: hypothetical protein IJL18_08745 [Synergistaceae bacterium]|nr:hypothetical protein [Synergistaceae bacterium]